jgi:hypothetical protein
MVTIQISESLAQQPEAIARQENRSVDDVAADILEHHLSDVTTDEPPGTLAALIQAAKEAGLHSGYTDTAERSREILNQEYPKYLSRKYGLEDKPDRVSGE